MKKQPAKRPAKRPAGRRGALTASDYLLFTEMLLALRALEHVVTDRFMNDSSNRTDIGKHVVKHSRKIQSSMPGYLEGRCHFPMCDAGDGTCEACELAGLRQELADALEPA